ncbi:hypothetical protein [Actinoplanes sp. NPDC051494]|uniref:DUF7336 domain-containing protein n=1 Tax=Actinoplanes sp. NPDC051494 TaxID=3363907 RepID=UPI00379C134F
MDVFLLWHVRHARPQDGGAVLHRDAGGALNWDEEYGDDPKMLGVYSSRERALERAGHARTLPGFRDEPDCFTVEAYQVDENHWTGGFDE